MSDVWHILGAGSIGGLFAHRLRQGGASVRLISSAGQPATRTIRLTQADTEFTEIFDCSPAEDTSPLSHLLVTVKSWAAQSAVKSIQHRINDKTVIVAMMNGMQHVDDIRAIATNCSLYLASTTAGCHRSEDRWITAGEGKTLIGHSGEPLPPQWFKTWQAGVPAVQWCTDIEARLIEKVAVNACINPMTAVHRIKNGALSAPEYQQTLGQVIAEVSLILDELGHATIASTLEQTVQNVILDTADNTSSMLSDVLAGRRTEIESIVGWLLDQSKHSHPTLGALLNRLRQISPAE